MERINETLWTDYNSVSSQIDAGEHTEDKYKLLLEERDKLRNELIKLAQTNIEAALKEQQMKAEAEVKAAQIEAENKREMIRNYITVGTFAVTTVVSIFGIYKTFYFDDKSTVTSTLGRAILNGVIPKGFKR